MKPLPESGTGRQIISQHLIGSLLGGAAGGQYGGYDPVSALTGAVAGGIAGPYAFGRLLQSAPGQAYLRNQYVTTPGAAAAITGPLHTLSRLGE